MRRSPMMTKTYTFKGNDPAAHEAAVLAAKLRLRYGTNDVAVAWGQAIDNNIARGMSRLAAIEAIGREQPELFRAYSAYRPAAPAQPVQPAPSPMKQRWEA